MPRNDSAYQPAAKPCWRAASRPAMAPAVSVIGSTPARVMTSQRETWSSSPSGGLTVLSA